MSDDFVKSTYPSRENPKFVPYKDLLKIIFHVTVKKDEKLHTA